MREAMRPMSLGEILDKTFQMYRTRFLRVFAVGALPSVIVLVFYTLSTGYSALLRHLQRTGASDYTLGSMTGWYFWIAGSLFLASLAGATALSLAALTEATARTFLGATFTIRGAYGSAWKRRWRNFSLFAMEFLIVVVIPWLAIYGILKLKRFQPVLAGLGGYGCTIVAAVLIPAVVVVAVWLLLRLSLGFPACVMEKVSAWRALKRSGVLSKKTKGRLLVVFLLGNALDLIFSLGVPYPVAIVTFIFAGAGGGGKHLDTHGVVLMYVILGLWIVVPSLVRPLYGIALTLIYYDQRMRREGYDVEKLMNSAGWTATETGTAEAIAVAPVRAEGAQG
jgi:hypothetical protein